MACGPSTAALRTLLLSGRRSGLQAPGPGCGLPASDLGLASLGPEYSASVSQRDRGLDVQAADRPRRPEAGSLEVFVSTGLFVSFRPEAFVESF